MSHSIWLWVEIRATGFESRPGRMFVIDIVHIQCSKLFKSLECTELSMALSAMKNPWCHLIREGHNPDFGLPSVAILPWLCRMRRKAIFTHSFNHSKMYFIFIQIRILPHECSDYHRAARTDVSA